MRRRTKAVLATGVALVLTAFAINHAYTIWSPNDPETPPVPFEIGSTRSDQLELTNWPASVNTSYGYTWGSYGLLSGFTEVENIVDAVDAYWKSGSGYSCFVERKLRLENGSGASLALTITRCPNYEAAKTRVLAPLTLMSKPPSEFHGQTYNLQLGDVSVLRDVPPVVGSYTGQDSNNLLFIRGNMVVDAVLAESNPASAGFTAADLCLEIDADILQQYTACGGNYPVPSASVAIDDPAGDLTTLTPPARIKATPASVSTSHPQSAPVQMHVFVAAWAEPRMMDANGFVVTDPAGTAGWTVAPDFETMFFDDARNPSTLTVQMSNDDGDWQMVAAVWGPNMVPVFAEADFSITR